MGGLMVLRLYESDALRAAARSLRHLFLWFWGIATISRLWLSRQLDSDWVLHISGALGDALAAACFAAVAYALLCVHRAAAVAWVVVITLITLANLEHIFALDAPLRLVNYRFALEDTFWRGSLLNIRNGGAMLVIIAMAGGLVYYIWRWRGRHSQTIAAALAVVVALTSGVGAWRHALWADGWRDASPLALVVTQRTSVVDVPASTLAAADAFFVNEVATGKKIALADKPRQPNVLVVILEGLPGVYLHSVQEQTGVRPVFDMPQFSKIAESGRVLTQFVTHGTGTINGLYNLLCGDYSLNIGEVTLKPYLLKTMSAAAHPQCLPRRLAAHGYHTVYMQAADLRYMAKNTVMPALGFAEVHGKYGQAVEVDADTAAQHATENFWGADDGAMFDRAVEKIKTLSARQSPWFLTLLTVGTHHPYLAPPRYLDAYPTAKEAAVRYLDDSLMQFVTALREAKVADDTLILFVSDESHGVDGHPFGQHWGLGVALGAGILPSINSNIFGQVDLPLSVLDYLELAADEAETTPLYGRSFFRDYAGASQQARALLFGEFLLNQQAVTRCQLGECRQYQLRHNQLFAPSYQVRGTAGSKQLYQTAVARANYFYGAGDRVQLVSVQDRQMSRRDDGIVRQISLAAGNQIEMIFDLENVSQDDFVYPFYYWLPVGRNRSFIGGQFSQLRLPPLPPGGQLLAHYTLAAETAQEAQFIFNAHLHHAQNGQLQVNAIQILSTPAVAATTPLAVNKFQLAYPPETQDRYNLAQFFANARPSFNPNAPPYTDYSQATTGDYFIAPAYSLGDRIDFTEQGSWRAAYYLAGGWSVPEAWGVWSDGKQPTIGFAITDAPTASHYEIVVEFYPHIEPPLVNERKLAFIFNGQVLGELSFRNGELKKRGVVVPASLLRQNAINTLTFGVADPYNGGTYGSEVHGFLGFGLGLVSFQIRPQG